MTSAAVNPLDNPEAWDVIRVGGVDSPGVCTVTGFVRKHEWDKKKGKGAAGETITFVQLPAADGKVKFQLWTRQHFVDWATFRLQLKYDPTKKAPQPVDIYYPALADIEIHSVVTENIGAIEHEGGNLYSITVDFLEYRPPPPASAVTTPTGSKTGSSSTGTNGTQPDPAGDAQQAQIAALLKEAGTP